MANNNDIYIFSKKATGQYFNQYKGTLLGEIQSDFNMSKTLDGTKDSMKCQVHSFVSESVRPFTIVWHYGTGSWWIVSHDKVDRYANDNNTFYYIHNLQLVGAVELLNARDLTDCAFNQGHYDISDVFVRLFNLSNFEFYVAEWDTDINPRIELNHVKTFENYTLLSALREFVSEYNYDVKLSFLTQWYEEDGVVLPLIDYAKVHLVSKSGHKNDGDIDISWFDDVREIKQIDKNSYGASVISNADNVISTVSKTYPSVGACRLSSKEWNITYQNCMIRLPSNVFKANWIKFYRKYNVLPFFNGNFSDAFKNQITNYIESIDPTSYASVKLWLDGLKQIMVDYLSQTYPEYATETIDFFNQNEELLIDRAMKAGTTTLFEGNQINATTGNIIQGDNVPYLAKIDVSDGVDPSYDPSGFKSCILTDTEGKKMLKETQSGIAWERGSNLITGFEGIFRRNVGGSRSFWVKDYMSTDLQENGTPYFFKINFTSLTNDYIWFQFDSNQNLITSFKDTMFQVNYIPMGDLKIKNDNNNYGIDTQMYNQNGKLTDSMALSKLMNSYAEEISTDNITRYKEFYKFNDIPEVGQIINVGNSNYVINNISYDFQQNDNEKYFIECEFTLSKQVAVKSLLTSPNTNIRDYGIPDKYNVKRKQVYRDLWKLQWTKETTYIGGGHCPYLDLTKVFGFLNSNYTYDTFICQMKIKTDQPINGSYYYYYQLETSTYVCGKSLYVVCDFLDNNIIGYSFMNKYGGFDIARLFNPTVSVNTPISYTDSNGRFQGIDLLFLGSTKFMKNIADYKDYASQGIADPDYLKTTIYNATCFIDDYLYETFSNHNYDIKISEPEYEKDTYEVPVFEYCFELNGTDNIIVGDEILTNGETEDDIIQFGYVVDDNLNEYNAYKTENCSEIDDVVYLNKGVKFTMIPDYPQYNEIICQFYQEVNINLNSGAFGYSIPVDPDNFIGKDIAIFKCIYNRRTQTTKKYLMFVLKNVKVDYIDDNDKSVSFWAMFQSEK